MDAPKHWAACDTAHQFESPGPASSGNTARKPRTPCTRAPSPRDRQQQLARHHQSQSPSPPTDSARRISGNPRPRFARKPHHPRAPAPSESQTGPPASAPRSGTPSCTPARRRSRTPEPSDRPAVCRAAARPRKQSPRSNSPDMHPHMTRSENKSLESPARRSPPAAEVSASPPVPNPAASSRCNPPPASAAVKAPRGKTPAGHADPFRSVARPVLPSVEL